MLIRKFDTSVVAHLPPKHAALIQYLFANPVKLDATSVNGFMSTPVTNRWNVRGDYGIVVLAIFETALSVPAVV